MSYKESRRDRGERKKWRREEGQRLEQAKSEREERDL